MQAEINQAAEMLPEATIRVQALNGGKVVPKAGSDEDLALAAVRLQKLVSDLLFTIDQVDVGIGHRAAACNLLCTVLSQCSQSPVDRFRTLVWDNQIWSRTFGIFLTQNQALGAKHLRQLLTTLTSMLQKCHDPSLSKATKDTMLQSLAGILCSTTEHVPIRPAMQALTHFLNKKVFSVGELQSAVCNVHESSLTQGNVEADVKGIMQAILQWAPYPDYSTSAGLLASAVLEGLRPVDARQAAQIPPTFHSEVEVPWAEPVLEVLAKSFHRLDIYHHYVFSELFRDNLREFVVFVERLGLHSVLGNASTELTTESTRFTQDELENLLFCALSVGNKMGLVQVAENSQPNTSDTLLLAHDALCIPDTLLGTLLLRTSSTVRIAGLSMLIASNTPTKPLSLGTIQALKNGLPHLHADTDAGFRSEMFSLIRNLTDRLRAASVNLFKLSSRQGVVPNKSAGKTELLITPQQAAELLKAHRSFLIWYLSFLKMELRPSASYQRHISAVKAIILIYRSGADPRAPSHHLAKTVDSKLTWPFKINVVDEDMTDLLLDLLMDPFDAVRQGAAEILSILPAAVSSEDTKHVETPRLVSILNKAEKKMMMTGRADHADGVAHLYNTIFCQCVEYQSNDGPWWVSKYGVLERLVQTLENTLKIAAEDVSKAVSKHPLHGIFISVRYIMETPEFYKSMGSADGGNMLRSLHHRLYLCFHSVWNCVKTTLCNDAPEGYVPDEMDDEDDIGTKDILSYSWRALKEASLLIRTLIKICPVADLDSALMTSRQLRDMGDLSFTQLAELRHRGAFSTVSQTFTTCCVRCNTGSEAASGTLQEWYQRAVLCIQNQTTINTRRSAGLPSLMVGIIIADESGGELFGKAVKDLTAESTKPVDEDAEQTGGLSQVHALNCLKEMFKVSKLGERSEIYVPAALGLAANCLSAESWAIRNSGLMLFRALLDRLLGSSDSHANQDTAPQSRMSFASVPSLMGVIFRLISPPLDTSKDLLTEGVFPALQLLQRTPPPADQLQKVKDAVLRLTASSQWHIRDKAAVTYAVLTAPPDRVVQAITLISGSHDGPNATHGALLSARYILQSSWASVTHENMISIFSTLSQAENSLYHGNSCPYTKAAFVDLYNDWCHAAYHSEHVFDDKNHYSALCAFGELQNLLYQSPDLFAAHSAVRQSLAHATLQEGAYIRSSGGDGNDPLDALVKLAQSDSDACTTVLAEVSQLCKISERFRKLAGEVLTKICTRLLFDNEKPVDLEVQTAAQDALVALLDSQQTETIQGVLREDVESLYLPINAATPLFQDDRLVLQGALLELRFSGAEAAGRSLPQDFSDWVVSLESALHEDNPFDTRFAAAEAAARINQGLKTIATSSEYAPSFLTFCLAVYDLTNDDDDEIRDIAASTACNIVQAGDATRERIDLIPIPAGSCLADYVAAHFGGSPDLAISAISRTTGGAVGGGRVRAVKDILDESSKQDTALFIQEKQNLFVDEARECYLWSQILTRLSLQALPEGQVQSLSAWVIEGLQILLATLDPMNDGPLGWKRRSGVFVLGLQVTHAAGALLSLAGKDMAGHISLPVAEIKDILTTLVENGKKKDMHPLWVEEAEKVLQK